MYSTHTSHITKIFDEHFEVRYPKNLHTTKLIQYLELREELIEDKIFILNQFLELPELVEYRRDGYGLEDPHETFEFSNYSTFTDFFISSQVDTPRCFRKTHSVRRSINETDLLKINNYLMRQGKRQKTLNLLVQAWNEISRQNRYTGLSWRALYLTLSSTVLSGKAFGNYPLINEVEMTFYTNLSSLGKTFKKNTSLQESLMKIINMLEPMFAFYIYKVDKKIYKNTRGKSGKYTFIWKYVAAYKRPHLVMFWLMRELKIKNARTFYERILLTLKTVLHSPKDTWMWRARRFSNNYVYYNCRTTLAETYRTSTK